jgi:hypothetical protein
MADPKPPKPSKGLDLQAPSTPPEAVADMIRKNRPPPIERFNSDSSGLPRLGDKRPKPGAGFDG